MSFNFQWPTFSETFQSDAASMLTSALNRGPKPKVIADDINVEDINMGTIPPDLEMLEIGELSTDRFRGIFRLTYAGDAHLTLSTKVQANPLTRPAPASSPYGFEDASSVFPSSLPSRGILFAARPLVVPMQLRLSAVRLKAIVVLVVSKQKGITLVFKNDPLESVDVSSTFDSVAVIQKYLQQEIEGQLREMFREDLPGIIHRLSQRWLSGNRDVQKGPHPASIKTNRSRSSTSAQAAGAGAASSSASASASASALASASTSALPAQPISRPTPGVEASTPDKKYSKQRSQKPSSETFITPKRSPSRRRKAEKLPLSSTPPSPRLTHRSSTSISTSPRANNGKLKSTVGVGGSDAAAKKEEADLSSSFGLSRTWNSSLIEDMERYDPTYGLRPDEVRMAIHGTGYSGLARLANQVNGGLRDLTREKEKESKEEENDKVEVNAAAVPEQALSPEDDDSEHDVRLPARPGRQCKDSVDVFGDDDDDVPDYPEVIDESEEDEDEEDGEEEGDESTDECKDVDDFDTAADFTMYGYPPPGAAFSDTAMEDSARRSASVFGFSSPVGGSPKVKQGVTRMQTNSGGSRPASVAASSIGRRSKSGKASRVEYETIPAVGGGIITRPRVYHSASRVQAPEIDEQEEEMDGFIGASTGASSTARGPSSSRTQTVRPARSYGRRSSDGSGEEALDRRSSEQSPSAFGEESLTTLEPEPMDPRSSAYRTQVYRQEYGRAYRAGYQRNSSLSSGMSSGLGSKAGYETGSSNTPPGWSTSRSSTAPTSTYLSNPADTTQKGGALGLTPSSPPEDDRTTFVRGGTLHSSRQNEASPLRPSNMANSQAMTLGASHHFMDLVNSNHTLSPFTRTLDTKGFAVRSHPVTPSAGSGGETSSSVGGFATRSSSLSSTPSHFVREGRSYFEKQQVMPETGAGKRRIFKMGAKKSGSASTPASPGGKRPGSSPLQASTTAQDDLPTQAISASSVKMRGPPRSTGGSSKNGQSESGRGNDLRRRVMGHNERSMTMGAIRE